MAWIGSIVLGNEWVGKVPLTNGGGSRGGSGVKRLHYSNYVNTRFISAISKDDLDKIFQVEEEKRSDNSEYERRARKRASRWRGRKINRTI